MTELSNSPEIAPIFSRRLLLVAGSVVIVNLLVAAWYWYETKTLQRKFDEWKSCFSQTDAQNARLKQLQTRLAPRYAEQYFAVWRLWAIVLELNTREQYPVTDGLEIVSCVYDPGSDIDRRWDPLTSNDPIRILFYVPPGNHRLVYGFKSDSERCKLKLPEKVGHDIAVGQVHEVSIFLETKDDMLAHLVMTVDESPIDLCVLQGRTISLDQRGIGFCCQLPNECCGPSDLATREPTWKYRSAMPNQLLKLAVSDRSDAFELRLGIESEAPDSGSAVILAARSKGLLRQLSREKTWMSLSNAKVDLRSLIPSPINIPDPTFLDVVPQIDEVFETPNGSSRLIFREGWAEKTKEVW